MYIGRCRRISRTVCRRSRTTMTIRPRMMQKSMPYATVRPLRPKAVEKFQAPCSSIAPHSPATGAATRAAPRCSAAYATPSPVIEVNSGCPNGEITPRMMKTASMLCWLIARM